MGGLSVDTNDSGFLAFKSHLDDLKSYFSSFGEIDSASVMYHHDKRHSRGFGFVLFKSASSVNTVIRSSPHIIKGKTVDVKKAYPKDELPTQPAESLAEPEDPRPRRLSPAKSLRSRPHRDSLQLEFFDEEDNNPLPASYTQPSPEDPLSPLSRPTPRTLPLPRFSYEPLAQPTYPLYEEPFSRLDQDWSRDYLHYPHTLLSPREDTLLPRRTFGSFSGEDLRFGSAGESLLDTASAEPTFSPRGLLGGRHASMRYDGLLATDPGLGDETLGGEFFSNEGAMRETRSPREEFTWRYFGDKEDVDPSMWGSAEAMMRREESMSSRTFSKNRRSRNHLMFTSDSSRRSPLDSWTGNLEDTNSLSDHN